MTKKASTQRAEDLNDGKANRPNTQEKNVRENSRTELPLMMNHIHDHAAVWGGG